MAAPSSPAKINWRNPWVKTIATIELSPMSRIRSQSSRFSRSVLQRCARNFASAEPPARRLSRARTRLTSHSVHEQRQIFKGSRKYTLAPGPGAPQDGSSLRDPACEHLQGALPASPSLVGEVRRGVESVSTDSVPSPSLAI